MWKLQNQLVWSKNQFIPYPVKSFKIILYSYQFAPPGLRSKIFPAIFSFFGFPEFGLEAISQMAQASRPEESSGSARRGGPGGLTYHPRQNFRTKYDFFLQTSPLSDPVSDFMTKNFHQQYCGQTLGQTLFIILKHFQNI